MGENVNDNQDPLPGTTDPGNDDTKHDVSTSQSKLENLWDKLPTSLFGAFEGQVSWAWIIFTSAYWTFSIWIPTIVNRNFDTYGLILWCVGAIGLFAGSYTIYQGNYPSGATKENMNEINGIGRYTTIIIVSAIMVDVVLLIMYATLIVAGDEDITVDFNLIFRLICHLIQLFWTSLFFYNRFYRFAKISAFQTFTFEWIDIGWSSVISFLLTSKFFAASNDYEAVRIAYFYFVTASLLGWILPMIILKQWGRGKYLKEVSIHVVVLDSCTDLPIIIVLLVTGAYKESGVLILDILVKSGVLCRSISFGIANMVRFQQETKQNVDVHAIGTSAFKTQWQSKVATFLWDSYVVIYWTIVVVIMGYIEQEISLQFEYYTWFCGIIGCGAIWYSLINGYAADSSVGPAKSMMALTCLIISIDILFRAFGALAWDELTGIDITAGVLHSIGILTSLIFFYGYTLKKGTGKKYVMAWLTLLVEYIDLLLTFIVICLLHYSLDGKCFNKSICSGYFVIFCIKTIFWFVPIVFGYSETERAIHIHMLALDCCTDLPLVVVIIATNGYNVNGFVFFDVAYKIIVLLRSIAYHGVIKLILTKFEENVDEADVELGNNDNAGQTGIVPSAPSAPESPESPPENAIPISNADVNVTVNVSTS